MDVQRLRPPPAGFGDCGACSYRTTGTPAICFACVALQDTGPSATACTVCGQPLATGTPCPNAACTVEDRGFSRIYTVTSRPEAMWDAVMSYKYDDQREWADVLGRVLVGYLDHHRDELQRFDLITTGAIYVGPDAQRLWDYLRLVLDAAHRHGPDWPFVPGLVHKARPTGRFLGISRAARREIAEGELRAALSVPARDRVAGRRVLVFDDVYSEGYSLREMARALLAAGATEVAGLVLTRRKGG
ncbi:MAG: phosphoribosyltransferase [Modestobacter sp.]|nr:phosphoribosyltransferase [Modestobacter sp.]